MNAPIFAAFSQNIATGNGVYHHDRPMFPSPKTTTAPAESGSSGRKFRVLYADDMAELRKLLDIGLTRTGHHIDCVANGQEALDKVAAAPDDYDVVITDHHMPVMNGLELVRHLRTLPYRGKILIFSSELSSAVDDAYRQLKVDHILQKPIYLSQLYALLAKF